MMAGYYNGGELEVNIVKKMLRHHKHPKWVLCHPQTGGRVCPANFKTEKAARRFLSERFSTITVAN